MSIRTRASRPSFFCRASHHVVIRFPYFFRRPGCHARDCMSHLGVCVFGEMHRPLKNTAPAIDTHSRPKALWLCVTAFRRVCHYREGYVICRFYIKFRAPAKSREGILNRVCPALPDRGGAFLPCRARQKSKERKKGERKRKTYSTVTMEYAKKHMNKGKTLPHKFAEKSYRSGGVLTRPGSYVPLSAARLSWAEKSRAFRPFGFASPPFGGFAIVGEVSRKLRVDIILSLLRHCRFC